MAAVDYSFDRPTIAALRSHNITAVGRYVGPPSWNKTITDAEYNTLLAAGISVWLVFERTATDAESGYAGGIVNAELATQHIPLAYPPNFPVYMAADQSLAGASLSTATKYIQGASTVLTVKRTGVYGEGNLLTACHDFNYASYFWQSSSTSFPGNQFTLPITNIQQEITTPLVDTDGDILLTPIANPIITKDVLVPMFAPPQTRDEFNATMRYVWYTTRTDAISEADMNAYWYAYHVPIAREGFGGSMDLVVAKIHDTAGKSLR